MDVGATLPIPVLMQTSVTLPSGSVTQGTPQEEGDDRGSPRYMVESETDLVQRGPVSTEVLLQRIRDEAAAAVAQFETARSPILNEEYDAQLEEAFRAAGAVMSVEELDVVALTRCRDGWDCTTSDDD